jgi:aspartate 1-decarboxylase
MFRNMLRVKIQRARVTASDLNYEGSITIDQSLMESADIKPFEKVHVLNLNNGARAETYVITGKKDSGEIIMNGAIARLVQIGDPLIILSYAWMEESRLAALKPKIVIVDEENHVAEIRH